MKKIQLIGIGGVIVNKKGEILLAQRNDHRKQFDGKWSIPGGHLEFGEQPEKALLREIKEELGVKVSILKHHCSVASYSYGFGDVKYHWILICYLCRIINGRPKVTNTENRTIKWFKIDEIDFTDCIPTTDILIKNLF